MGIKEKVSEIMTQEAFRLNNDKKLKEFSEYYKKLKETGIAKKEEYNIPLIKTIGVIPF